MDNLINLLYGLIDLLYAIIHLENLIYSFKNIFRVRRRQPIGFKIPKSQPRYKPKKSKRKPAKSYLSKREELEREVVQLLRGDKQAARRLVKKQIEMNPGKIGIWYLEKVIHDLKRDRNYY